MYMKILITLLLSLPLICTPLAASADKGGNKGPDERAWERANDNASFKRGDDYEKHDKKKTKKQGFHDHDDHNDGRYLHRDDRDYDRDDDRNYRTRDSDYRGSRDPNQDRDDRYRDRDYRNREK